MRILLLSPFLLLLLFLHLRFTAADSKVTSDFPPHFLWATATAAFQIEGATREDGRGLSIWDTFQRENGTIMNGDNGDIADDSYHKYKEDIKLMKQLGTKAYRMSFSWSRIFPSGRNQTNPLGVKYYHDVLDELIANNIVPLITLYHWDLPQALQDLGGWLHPDVSKWMEEYARFCFQEYGSKVHYWITINEAYRISLFGYGHNPAKDAPGLTAVGDWAEFLAGHNVVLAHARVYRLYEREFKEKYGGEVGMVNCMAWMEPLTDSDEDRDAAQLGLDHYFGQYVDPMMTGDYSPHMKDFVRKQSEASGRVNSILPDFTEEEKEMLKGAYDFVGMNYYFTLKVRKVREDDQENGILPLHWGAYGSYDQSWTPVGPPPQWIYDTPDGLYKALKYLKERYGDFPIMITENGCMDTPGEGMKDTTRIHYLQGHIEAVGKAISEGVNVTGYALWSLLDNFEWMFGYYHKFGLYHVDFSDPERPRTPKASAKWYSELIQEKTAPRLDQNSQNPTQNFPSQNQNPNQTSENTNQNVSSQNPEAQRPPLFPNEPQQVSGDIQNPRTTTSGNVDDKQNLRPIAYPNEDNVKTQRPSAQPETMQNGPLEGPKEETKPTVPTTTTVNRGDLPLFELGTGSSSPVRMAQTGNDTSSSVLNKFSVFILTSCVVLLV